MFHCWTRYSNVRVVLRVAKWDKSNADGGFCFFLFFFFLVSNRNTLSRCLSLFRTVFLPLVFRPSRSSVSFHSCSRFHHFCTLFLRLVWWRVNVTKSPFVALFTLLFDGFIIMSFEEKKKEVFSSVESTDAYWNFRANKNGQWKFWAERLIWFRQWQRPPDGLLYS